MVQKILPSRSGRLHWSLMGTGSQLGFAFLSFVILVRVLPVEYFGLWVLYQTTTVFAEMARNGFIQNGFIKLMTEHPKQQGDIFVSSLVFSCFASLTIGLLLIPIGLLLSQIWAIPKLFFLLLLYPFYTLLQGLVRFHDFWMVQQMRFKRIFQMTSIQGSLYLTFCLFCWHTDLVPPLEWLIMAQAAAACATLGCIFWINRANLPLGKVRLKWIKRIFHFGKHVAGTNLGSLLLKQSDLIMIGAMLNPMAVAMYSIAVKLNNYMEVPLSSMANVLYPQLVREKAGSATFKKLLFVTIGKMYVVIVPIALFLAIFPEQVIGLVAGTQYASAAPILVILMIGATLKPMGRVAGIALDASGKPSLNFRLIVLSLTFNVLLNLWLIPKMGASGSALATVIATSVGGLVSFLKVIRFSKNDIYREQQPIPIKGGATRVTQG